MEWRYIPKEILESSVIILDCRRIFFINECEGAAMDIVSQPTMLSRTKTETVMQKLDIGADKTFIAMIKDKEAKGDVVWLETSVERLDNNKKSVDPKWAVISQWLQSQIDPITGLEYTPLQLSVQWWRQRYVDEVMQRLEEFSLNTKYFDTFTRIEYCGNIAKIIGEISRLGHAFKAMSEILKQSNPTLIPMAKWSESIYESKYESFIQLFGIDKAVTESDDITDKSMNIERSVVDNHVSFGVEDEDGFVYLC